MCLFELHSRDHHTLLPNLYELRICFDSKDTHVSGNVFDVDKLIYVLEKMLDRRTRQGMGVMKLEMSDLEGNAYAFKNPIGEDAETNEVRLTKIQEE
jgi:hypothetical protein